MCLYNKHYINQTLTLAYYSVYRKYSTINDLATVDENPFEINDLAWIREFPYRSIGYVGERIPCRSRGYVRMVSFGNKSNDINSLAGRT